MTNSHLRNLTPKTQWQLLNSVIGTGTLCLPEVIKHVLNQGEVVANAASSSKRLRKRPISMEKPSGIEVDDDNIIEICKFGMQIFNAKYP